VPQGTTELLAAFRCPRYDRAVIAPSHTIAVGLKQPTDRPSWTRTRSGKVIRVRSQIESSRRGMSEDTPAVRTPGAVVTTSSCAARRAG